MRTSIVGVEVSTGECPDVVSSCDAACVSFAVIYFKHLLDLRFDLADQERLALDLVQALGVDQVLAAEQQAAAGRCSARGPGPSCNRFSTSPVFFGIGLR